MTESPLMDCKPIWRAGDWIEWNGGECPVTKGTALDVRDADGFVWENVRALDYTNNAEMWEQLDSNRDHNIRAYRLVEPSELPQGNRDADSALTTQVGGDHYKGAAIQPVEFCVKNKMESLESNIVKRAFRHDKPTGKGREDVEKIIHEARLLLELKYEVGA